MEEKELAWGFNELFLERRYGGIFDYENDALDYEANFGETLTYLRGFINGVLDYESRNKKKPVVYVNYIYNERLNAVAAKDTKRGVYYIGINCGIVYLLERLFNTILSNPLIFPNIGEGSKEAGTHIIDKSLYTSVKNFIDNSIPLDYDKPKDELRRALAEYLSLLALGYLVMHELVHIINGHVDYMRATKGLRVFQENSFSYKTPEENLLSQTLEFDADSVAMSTMVFHVSFMHSFPENIKLKYRRIVQQLDIAIGFTAFAAYTIFKIFENDTLAIDSVFANSHPSFNIRRRIIGPTIATLVLDVRTRAIIKEEVLSKVVPTVAAILLGSEQAFKQVENDMLLEAENVLKQISLDEIGMHHTSLLKKHWSIIRPSLLPYALNTLVESTED